MSLFGKPMASLPGLGEPHRRGRWVSAAAFAARTLPGAFALTGPRRAPEVNGGSVVMPPAGVRSKQFAAGGHTARWIRQDYRLLLAARPSRDHVCGSDAAIGSPVRFRGWAVSSVEPVNLALVIVAVPAKDRFDTA